MLYSNKKVSRPNTPVNVIVGTLILKEALGVMDVEMVHGLMFDMRYQYALRTTSFEGQLLSDRTRSHFAPDAWHMKWKQGLTLSIYITGLAKEISGFMVDYP